MEEGHGVGTTRQFSLRGWLYSPVSYKEISDTHIWPIQFSTRYLGTTFTQSNDLWRDQQKHGCGQGYGSYRHACQLGHSLAVGQILPIPHGSLFVASIFVNNDNICGSILSHLMPRPWLAAGLFAVSRTMWCGRCLDEQPYMSRGLFHFPFLYYAHVSCIRSPSFRDYYVQCWTKLVPQWICN